MKSLRIVLLVVAALSLVSCDSTLDSPTTIQESYLHGRAAWSPDGKSIVFSSLVESQVGMYITDTMGTSVRQIVQGEGVGATWSPDGKWIAFSRSGSLYRVKPSGDSLQQLTDAIGAIRPAWSKDGSKIAFVIRSSTGLSAPWLFDVAGKTTTQLFSRGDFPMWHPTTGELVLLDGQYDAASGYVAYSFFAVTIANTSTRVVATFSASADCGFCSMRPSGTDIAFGLLSPSDYSQIWVYNITQNRHTKITTDGGDYPAWSPDGSRIVYTRTQKGDGGLWIMNPDGTGGRRLTKAQ
jgi:Tol biopolymer transport system component